MNINGRLRRAETEALRTNRCPGCRLRPYTVVYGNDPEAGPEPCPECGTVRPHIRVVYEEGEPAEGEGDT